ncbi:HAD-IIA family hydrolase [Cohaesibacter haloalkalitolerans]|uniref:HAD-IIA family hydrolase n=1 Tax=Cohaesibacter haloalkalitolerans TaxID=1162980 RepID=UPI000E65929C|nr:HAD-IIA family hydrolase [Cohaesibacter haloalkalitolerans]
MSQATLSSEEAFNRYEAVRERFPLLPVLQRDLGDISAISSLADIAGQFDAFVFDAFGVLNIGDRAIEGACEQIDQLRKAGKRLFVLTNAASYRFEQVVEKFEKLGFSFRDDELISSRAVCEMHLGEFDASLVWGVVAPKDFMPEELAVKCHSLLDEAATYDQADAFLILSSESWTGERQELLVASLARKARPVVVANPDLVAPRETGLTVEPGYYAHDLLDRVPGLSMIFHGKPFASVYDEVERRLGDTVTPHRIAMMGDSLHTDIWGARVRGWGSVLVTDHGFLRRQDPFEAIRKSGIVPDFMTPSI